jgi:hypothetical protein
MEICDNSCRNYILARFRKKCCLSPDGLQQHFVLSNAVMSSNLDRSLFERTLMRPASPFQSFDFRESSMEADACFVSAEATVTAAVDLRLREAKKPGLGTSYLVHHGEAA